MNASTATLTTLQSNASVDDVLEVIDRDGGVIIADFIDAATIAGLLEDLEPHFARVSVGEDGYFAGTRTQRVGGIFGRSRHAATVGLAPLFYETAQRILTKPVDVWFGEDRTTITPGIQIGVTQAIRIMPGQGSQPLHRDDTSFLWRHPHYGREARLQIMVALSDFTADNGATLVIPGSHRWDDDRKPTLAEVIPAVMPVGSALLWIGSTYHAGGQNTSTGPRTGLTIGYDLSNLRQEENQFLAVPVDEVRALPESIQRMLGWDAGANFMGWVEVNGQMIDPHILLADPATTSPLGA